MDVGDMAAGQGSGGGGWERLPYTSQTTRRARRTRAAAPSFTGIPEPTNASALGTGPNKHPLRSRVPHATQEPGRTAPPVAGRGKRVIGMLSDARGRRSSRGHMEMGGGGGGHLALEVGDRALEDGAAVGRLERLDALEAVRTRREALQEVLHDRPRVLLTEHVEHKRVPDLHAATPPPSHVEPQEQLSRLHRGAPRMRADVTPGHCATADEHRQLSTEALHSAYLPASKPRACLGMCDRADPWQTLPRVPLGLPAWNYTGNGGRASKVDTRGPGRR